MRLSKAGYYADLFVYPPVVMVLTAVGSRGPHSHFFGGLLLSCLLGIAGWTFVEYLMHRFVLHSIRAAAEMHDLHHANPTAYIGIPTWLSLACFAVGGFIPLWFLGGLEIASGAVTGLMIGYVWYIVVHNAVHRWRLDHESFLYPAKLRHAVHHYGKQDGNFGVTTAFWDRVFGTTVVGTREIAFETGLRSKQPIR
jgi:sterol desaturase/sphingolipid hydroxylase (fatty acid hydroxylase superfamily)